jgi:hypothetical protein
MEGLHDLGESQNAGAKVNLFYRGAGLVEVHLLGGFVGILGLQLVKATVSHELILTLLNRGVVVLWSGQL